MEIGKLSNVILEERRGMLLARNKMFLLQGEMDRYRVNALRIARIAVELNRRELRRLEGNA